MKIVTIEGELNYLSGVYKKNSEEEHLVKLARDKCLQYINLCTRRYLESVPQMNLLRKFFENYTAREYWFGENGFRLECIIGESANCMGKIQGLEPPIRPDSIQSISLQKGAYILSSNRYSIPPEMGGPQLGTPLNEEAFHHADSLQDASKLQIGHLCAVRNEQNPTLYFDKVVPRHLIDDRHFIDDDDQDLFYQTQDGAVEVGDWVAAPRTDDKITYGIMKSDNKVKVRSGGEKELQYSDDKRYGVFKLKPSATFLYACVQSITDDAITLQIGSYQSSIISIPKENSGTNIKTLPLSSGGPYLKPDKSWLLSWLPKLIRESNGSVLISKDHCKFVQFEVHTWQSVDKYVGTFSVQ